MLYLQWFHTLQLLLAWSSHCRSDFSWTRAWLLQRQDLEEAFTVGCVDILTARSGQLCQCQCSFDPDVLLWHYPPNPRHQSKDLSPQAPRRSKPLPHNKHFQAFVCSAFHTYMWQGLASCELLLNDIVGRFLLPWNWTCEGRIMFKFHRW